MERYFQTTKQLNRTQTTDRSKKSRFQPYPKKNSLLDLLPESDGPPSSSTITKLLMKSLKEDSNPITHSDIYERTEHLVSMASGHQVSESRRNHREYHDERSHKLAAQKEFATTEILSNIKVYIDGLLEDTTDIEIKRIVSQAGGQVLYSASGATHIITSQPLNGSKTHKLLTKKSRISVHVVKPEWVFDSIKAGRRRPERDYTILRNKSTMDITKMLQTSNPNGVS
ncbi:hypothetical protein D9757_002663 [Collybiopsis confluens]|uniref:BRCT domain-containing protein n=1 Tax=Collybiopsis confluens TaxID=2823264 RepID=A0A8H5HX08_9AGAR|nr:hypothetical protein D9757_002663 [Collybiopsis confluens]